MMQWNAKVYCQDVQETHQRLLFKCSYSEKIWKSLAQGRLMDTDYTSEWSFIIQLALDKYIDKVKLFLLRYALQIMTHSIWRERNSRHHGERYCNQNA